MMRKNITRTLTRATISAFTAKMVNGVPEVETLEPVTAWGNLTEREAIKAVRDKYGKDANVMVGEVTFEEETYKISIDDFVALAQKVENGTSEEDESEDEEEDADNVQ